MSLSPYREQILAALTAALDDCIKQSEDQREPPEVFEASFTTSYPTNLPDVRALRHRVVVPLTVEPRFTSLPVGLDPALLSDGFAQVERHDKRVAYLIMSARAYADCRKFGRDILDIETLASEMKRGKMANLWGATIFTSSKVPDGHFVMLEDGYEEEYAAAKDPDWSPTLDPNWTPDNKHLFEYRFRTVRCLAPEAWPR